MDNLRGIIQVVLSVCFKSYEGFGRTDVSLLPLFGAMRELSWRFLYPVSPHAQSRGYCGSALEPVT